LHCAAEGATCSLVTECVLSSAARIILIFLFCFNSQEDIIESVERTGRSADCVVHTEVTRGNKAADANLKPPDDGMRGLPEVLSDITRLDDYKPAGGFDNLDIPVPVPEYGADVGGRYDAPKNPPNLLNDYGGPSKQEYGQESEKSYGSSTSMRRQEAYDHQEYSHEKTRTLPGWRSGWGGAEASDDPQWKIKYDTSANEINEVSTGTYVTGNLMATFVLEMLLAYVMH
jgi:hypothetical protein